MKTIGIVQARTSSTRLPGKVLLEIVGIPVILLMLERVSHSKKLNNLWLATSKDPSDDQLSSVVSHAGYNVFRGSLNNVLSRFWQIGKDENAESIVRLTGDCPLHDPAIIDVTIDYFISCQTGYDYVSNVLPPTYPDGLDTEVFSFSALEDAYAHAENPFDLEHVTPFIRKKARANGRFGNYIGPADFSHLRWTLDQPEDYEFISKVFADLYFKKKDFSWFDVIAWQTKDPQRLKINNNYMRNQATVRRDKTHSV